ncbi:MAG: RagB/SusD family nutrient uptake outer membrane protein [Chitinophagaceae bacterium]|nr:MAG: RagB/SusD family nutrient uptake outer membrane protein [Chitinophagaceae bacterium]
MKNLKLIYVACLCAIMIGTGCKKEYLQLDPPETLTPASVFATTKNAYAAINGIHRMMYVQWYGSQALGGHSGNMIYMDILGEDFVMTANANGWFISEYRWLQHRNDASTISRFSYGFYYTIIANANVIIANIDDAVGPDADKKAIKGQAYAYRAWSYFQMVQLFGERFDKNGPNSGLGMSLVLEPKTGALPRSTVAETYAQINQDIDQAIELLDGLPARPSKSHLNVNVAKGIKARIALTQQNWPVAAEMASEARQGFALMSNAQYLQGFSNTSNSEWIWGIDHRDDHPTYFYSFYAYLGNFSSTNTRGNPKAIFAPLYDQISATDVRKQLWDPTGANTAFPVVAGGTRYPYMTRKFLLDNPGNSNGDLVFMRSAEMYLIEAEALARQGGQDAAAQQALFTLANQRDPNYVLSTNAGQALIDEIMMQRRVELWGEGFRFYDLKRTNTPLDRTGGNHNNTLAQKMVEPAGTLNWQLLIPRTEIEYTLGVVKQNPL